MKKIKLIGSILLIALGALIICFSVRGLMGVPQTLQSLGSAVYLDEPVVLPENEGKTVIVHGKVEMTQPAYDAELGLTLNTIKACRYDEEYEQAYDEDKEMLYEWRPKGTESIVGEARMGEFELDAGVLMRFPAESDYSDFESQEIRKYGTSWIAGRTYVLVDADLYYSENYSLRQGSKHSGDRVSRYNYYDASRYDAQTTIAAVQQGSKLVAHEAMGALVKEGVLSRTELMKAHMGTNLAAGIFFLALGIAPVCLGLKGLRKPKTKKKGKKRKKS